MFFYRTYRAYQTYRTPKLVDLLTCWLVDLLTRWLVGSLTCWLAMWLFRHEGVFEAEEVEHAVDADGGDALLGCFFHLWLGTERDAQTGGF